jgi:predicted CoA-binding protein
MAGYSGTPLLKKLGIRPEMKVWLVNPPDNYSALLDTDISSQLCKKKETPDLVHVFVKNKAALEAEMNKLKTVCKKNPACIIWVSWYKKSSNIPTDLTEDAIRDYALKNDLVDVKVCAVSDAWSGLKLVVPLAKR